MTLEEFIANRGKMIENLQSKIDRANEKIQHEINGDNNEKRIAVYQSQITRHNHSINQLKLQQAFAREDSAEDKAERLHAYKYFASEMRKVLSDNFHLKFHGTGIVETAQIIPAGSISSSVDRIGSATSYDVEDQVSVTDKDSLETTVMGYTHLGDDFLPSGCIFAMLPRDAMEDSASRSLLMGNVFFRENPTQLYAIITSSENKEMVAEWCKNNGVETHVVTFEESLALVEKDSKALDSVVDIMGDKINLSNHIDIMSAIDIAPLVQNMEKDNIDTLLESIKEDKRVDTPIKDSEISL